jgi:hypothetical protein
MASLTDPERDHLLGRIADLEQRLRWWRLTSLALLGLLVLPVVLGGLLGMWWTPRLERERAMLEAERERAVRAEMEAVSQRDRAERALIEAERQRALAEEEGRRQHGPDGAGRGKD